MGIITDVILPLALAFIMFALGLGLTKDDFLRVFVKPKDFLIGLFSQVIILPIVGLFLIFVWPLPPELAMGVMIIAAAPGGVTSNVLTSFAKGDVALSISLTAIISILSVITIPIVLLISLSVLNFEGLDQNQSLFDIALRMFLIVTVPVIVGMICRSFLNSFENMAKKISIVLFVLVLIGAILSERANIVTYFAQAGAVTLALNIIMMIIAFYLSKSLIANQSQQRAITIECGLQNGTLAIVVASLFFESDLYLIPAATYSLIMYATSLSYIYFLRRS